MARSERIELEVGVRDDASKVIDRLASKIDSLEADEARIVVTAQVNRLEEQLDRARLKLESLSGDEATVQARLIGTLEQDLEDARRLFEQLDGQTGTVKITADTASARRDLSALNEQLDGLTSKAADLAPGLGAAFGALGKAGPIGAGVAALAAGFVVAADSAADTANEVLALQNLIGGTAEEASGLSALWKQSGADAKDLQDVILQMNGVLAQSPELATQLGINLTDGASGAERLTQIVSALNSQISDVTQRGVLGSQLFGEEGVRQVNQLVTLVGTDLKAAIEGLPDGLILSDKDLDNALEFQKEIKALQADFQAITLEVGSALVPALKLAASTIGSVSDFLGDSLGAAEDLGRSIAFWNKAEREANEAKVAAYEKAVALANEYRDAVVVGATSVEEVTARAKEFGLEQESINLLIVEWARANGIATTAAEKAAQANVEAADAAQKAAEATGDLTTAISDLNRTRTDRLREGLDAIFGRTQSNFDTIGTLQGIGKAIEDITTQLGDGTVPTLDQLILPGDRNEALLSGIRDLASGIQAELDRALAEGGPEGFRTSAENWVQAIIDQFGPDQGKVIVQALGLDNIDATVDTLVEFDQRQIARAYIDAVKVIDPRLGAELELAWATGADPDSLISQAESALSAAGVTLPVRLTSQDVSAFVGSLQASLPPVYVTTRLRSPTTTGGGAAIPQPDYNGDGRPGRAVAGQPLTVNVNVPTADPSATVRAIQRWSRTNGALPITRGRG